MSENKKTSVKYNRTSFFFFNKLMLLMVVAAFIIGIVLLLAYVTGTIKLPGTALLVLWILLPLTTFFALIFYKYAQREFNKHKLILNILKAVEERKHLILLFDNTRHFSVVTADYDPDFHALFATRKKKAALFNDKKETIFLFADPSRAYLSRDEPVVVFVAFEGIGQALDVESLFVADVLEQKGITKDRFMKELVKRAQARAYQALREQGYSDEEARALAVNKDVYEDFMDEKIDLVLEPVEIEGGGEDE